ncbi:MAG: DUF1385 domain-containing protein [Lachnospiraceae bacterium]
MKYSVIGGQAVIEGIMMKNGDDYAVAVRKPNRDIEVKIDKYKGIMGENRIVKLPFIRGVFSFIDSLVLGMSSLSFSASFFEDEEELKKPSKSEKLLQKIFKGNLENIIMTITILFSIMLAVGLFMVLPVFIANLLKPVITSITVLALVEGLIRIGLFIAYVALISLMKDIKRVYMYHGAEHKCINCIEHGLELTVDNVEKSSRQHKRCGTSFMLIVMVISVVFFIFLHVETLWLRVITRIILIPVIAGISYEVLRLAGRSDNKIINFISAPGLWLQGLTTKEPDRDMIEVAIKAVEAVFDWRGYLAENFDKTCELPSQVKLEA